MNKFAFALPVAASLLLSGCGDDVYQVDFTKYNSNTAEKYVGGTANNPFAAMGCSMMAMVFQEELLKAADEARASGTIFVPDLFGSNGPRTGAKFKIDDGSFVLIDHPGALEAAGPDFKLLRFEMSELNGEATLSVDAQDGVFCHYPVIES